MSAPQRYYVSELFGPTFQGEGPEAGRRCYFVRFGGCDFRCSWCDTPYAVLPERIRAEAEHMTATEIVARLLHLGLQREDLVVLSGGNPALQHGGPFMHVLRSLEDRPDDVYVDVSIETQGTVWREWLREVDLVVVSPKPPSSGMATPHHEGQAIEFMNTARQVARTALKFVAFDDADLEWAIRMRPLLDPQSTIPTYLSAGTDQEGVALDVAALERFRWLANTHTERADLAPFRISLQQHVLVWPGERNR